MPNQDITLPQNLSFGKRKRPYKHAKNSLHVMAYHKLCNQMAIHHNSECRFPSVCKQLGIQTLHVIAVSFAVVRKSRIGSQDLDEYAEETGGLFESGVGVAKHANVSNQLQSSAMANTKTHAGVRASSGPDDETIGTNNSSNPQTQSEEAENVTTILRSKCSCSH